MRLGEFLTEGRQMIFTGPRGAVSASVNPDPAEIRQMLTGVPALAAVIDRSTNTLYAWDAQRARPADAVAALRIKSPILAILRSDRVEVETPSVTKAVARQPVLSRLYGPHILVTVNPSSVNPSRLAPAEPPTPDPDGETDPDESAWTSVWGDEGTKDTETSPEVPAPPESARSNLPAKAEPQLFDLTKHMCQDYKKHVAPLERIAPQMAKRMVTSYTAFNQRVHRARKYILDNDMIRVVAHIAAQPPEYFLKHLNSCRLPFDTVWFQWDQGLMLRALHEAGVGSGPNDDLTGSMAVLCETLSGSRIRMEMVSNYFSDETRAEGDVVGMVPFGFITDLDQPVAGGLLDDDRFATDLVRDFEGRMRENVAIGVDYQTAMDEQETGSALDQLSRHIAYSASGPMGQQYRDMQRLVDQKNDPVHRMLFDFQIREMKVKGLSLVSGVWRTVMAILIMLNTSGSEVDTDTLVSPRGSKSVRGKAIPYMEYRRVGLKLPRDKIIRRINKQTQEYRPKRRHEVAATWCYRTGSGDPNCSHPSFQPVPETRFQECPDCGRLRWRRQQHLRGDASLGFVKKDYHLKPNERAGLPGLDPDPDPQF